MAYVFQTFTVGQVLTAAQTNQIEVNIRDHVHGVAGVSMATRIAKVTRQTSTALGADPAATWRAMIFDTKVTDNGSFFNTSSPAVLIIPANGIYSVAYVSDQSSRFDFEAVFMLQVNSNRNMSMVKTLVFSGTSLSDQTSHWRTDLFTTFIASTNDLVRLLFASQAAGEMITGPLDHTVNSGGRFTSLTINQIG